MATAAESPPPPPRRRLRFRVTGASAQDRLRPLLRQSEREWGVEWCEVPDAAAAVASSPEPPLDFVWETQLPRRLKTQHERAVVRNRLANAGILEDKAHLALLQARFPSTVPTLETHVLRAADVHAWVAARGWGSGSNEGDAAAEEDWWALKARGANGGMDVRLLNPRTAPSVVQALREQRSRRRRHGSDADEDRDHTFVAQRYLARPLLYGGRKFHLRVYALLRIQTMPPVCGGGGGEGGGGSGQQQQQRHRLQPCLSRWAFRLAASAPYSLAHDDETTHLTNLSVNRASPGYPGQEPVFLPTDYAAAWPNIKAAWRAAVVAAAPFMAVQPSPHGFELFGLDFLLAEDARTCFLLEANRLPGLTSSAQNSAAEDRVFDGMMRELLRLCVRGPLLPGSGSGSSADLDDLGNDGDGKDDRAVYWEEAVAQAHDHDDDDDDNGLALEAVGAGAPVWRNVLRFGLFARKQLLLQRSQGGDG